MDDSLCVFFHSTAPMRYSKNHSSRVEFTLNTQIYNQISNINHCSVKSLQCQNFLFRWFFSVFVDSIIHWMRMNWMKRKRLRDRERVSECLWSSFPKLKQFQNISNCFWRVWNVSSYQVNIERMSTKNMLLSFWWVLTVFRHKCMHTFDTLQTHSIKIRNIVDFSCAPK